MIRTQIQLTESQMQALRKLAISRRVSLAGLIRQAIGSMIESSPQDDLEERRKRALAIVGKFGSSKHDISTKYDDYLDFCRNGFQPRLSEESAIWVATGSRSFRGTVKSGSQPRSMTVISLSVRNRDRIGIRPEWRSLCHVGTSKKNSDL